MFVCCHGPGEFILGEMLVPSFMATFVLGPGSRLELD